MSLAGIATFLLQASIFLIVFSLGLRATLSDALSLFRRPGMLARSVLSMNVVMPIFASILAWRFGMPPAVKIALVMLALSPVPPILPQRQLGVGGKRPYVHGLLTAMALLSIVIIPVAIDILGRIFGRDIHVGPLLVAKVVGKSILLPLGLGVLMRSLAAASAQKASRLLARAGNLLLLVSVLPVLVFAWRPILDLIGNGTVLAMIAFALVAVATGHLLGGPDFSERSALALATATRHPGLALSVALATFPAQRKLELGAILLYVIVSLLVLLPYDLFCKRRLSATRVGTEQKAA